MATIKYNGMEIESISECKVFDDQHNMLVWNRDFETPIEKFVCAIIPYRHEGRVITRGGAYDYCAEVHEKPKQRRATNRELARWLANVNGGLLSKDDGAHLSYTHYEYEIDIEDDKLVKDEIKVRKWEDTECHEPTVDYMGIEG